MRIGIITLGCDKNTVDTEYLAGILEKRGHEILTEGTQGAVDVLVIYTCGFIEAARAQSVDTLEFYLDAKRRLGNPRYLVLVGCLTQRYGAELRAELPDVDAFAGVGQPELLANLVESVSNGKAGALPAGEQPIMQMPSPSMRIDHALPRKRLDDSPLAYLRVADGCNHQCSFCAIPAMKGPYTSMPREIVLDEARQLLNSGVRELSVIGQDIGPYGRDLYEDYGLPELLTDLCRLEGDFWIRLLYVYPSGLTDRLLDAFAREPKICKYIDIPLQHLDAKTLKAMRRPASEEDVINRINELRKRVPDVAIRTTMIVGFPGETAESFQNLLRGIREIEFERLGAFFYSREEGTPAALLPHSVPHKTAERRLDRLMNIQAEISANLQSQQVGKELRVLIESISEDGTEARGRSYREAPEVDGEIIIRLNKQSQNNPIMPGNFVTVRITESDTYDLFGEITG